MGKEEINVKPMETRFYINPAIKTHFKGQEFWGALFFH